MARRYVVSFENVAVSAAQDLIQIKNASGSNKLARIIRAWWGCTDTSLATSQSARTRCRVLPSTVTDGSGGSTPTVTKRDSGDAAATVTALANNTTPATTGGTAAVVETSGDHVYNGYQSRWDEKGAPVIAPAQSFVLELLSTLSGTAHLSGGIELEEIG